MRKFLKVYADEIGYHVAPKALCVVLPTGIEPVFPASEASGLSVNLRELEEVLRVFVVCMETCSKESPFTAAMHLPTSVANAGSLRLPR